VLQGGEGGSGKANRSAVHYEEVRKVAEQLRVRETRRWRQGTTMQWPIAVLGHCVSGT